MHIAIVGLGVTGSAVLIKLTELFNLTSEDRIDIYEPRERLGAGSPYDEDDDSIVINTYPDSLSIVEGNRLDFIDWLKLHHPQDDYKHTFVSRTYYGEYMNEKIQPYLDLDYVNIIPQKVVNLRMVDKASDTVIYHRQKGELSYQVCQEDGSWSQTYDAVFMTMGHPPYRDAYNLIGSPNYIQNPYPLKDRLKDINPNQRIGIIGSGLTTVDLLRYLTRYHQFTHPITLYIRNEPFTSVIQPRYTGSMRHSFTPKWRKDQKIQHGGTIPLDTILDQIKADLESNAIDLESTLERYGTGSISEIEHEVQLTDDNYIHFQAYLASIYMMLEELVNDLGASDRQRFFQETFKLVVHFYSQAPDESFRSMLEMLEKGSLRIVSGLSEIEPTDTGFDLQADGGLHQADILVNATGFEYSILKAKEQNELINNLYEQNLIIPNELGHLMVTWPQTQPINRPFGTLDRVYVIGTWIYTTQLLNASASANMRQARKAVRFFKDSLA